MNPTVAERSKKKRKGKRVKEAKTCHGFYITNGQSVVCTSCDLWRVGMRVWRCGGANEIDRIYCRKLRCGILSVDLIDYETMVSTKHTLCTHPYAFDFVPVAAAKKNRVKQILTINSPFTLSLLRLPRCLVYFNTFSLPLSPLSPSFPIYLPNRSLKHMPAEPYGQPPFSNFSLSASAGRRGDGSFHHRMYVSSMFKRFKLWPKSIPFSQVQKGYLSC